MSTDNTRLLASMAWVAQLCARYEAVLDDNHATDDAIQEQLPALQFASAIIDKLKAEQSYPHRSRHIAVLGPTQSGKSSLVNLLLDTQAASVSAMAGFTVHTQGYGATIEHEDSEYVAQIMAPLRKTPAMHLDSEALDTYVLEPVNTGSEKIAAEAIVWDTPDFDSIDARSYALAVLKTAALADVVILVASKDKYGDKRVWDMLALLQALNKPLLMCINKLDKSDQPVVEQAFTNRYTTMFDSAPPDLVMLPFIRQNGTSTAITLDSDTHYYLQQAVHRVSNRIDDHALATSCQQFIHDNQSRWLTPLLNEFRARATWQDMVSEQVASADEYYTSHYLENPDKYDTFNRTLAELLSLLEIPGVAPVFSKARKIVTWPARRLLGVGQQALGKHKAARVDSHGQPMDQEALVLEHIVEKMLIKLQRELMEAPAEPFWSALDKQMRAQISPIRAHYESHSDAVRQQFAPEIERTAASLYKKLQTQPTLLNTLRAARASADAAGVALAVKTGGLAPTDLILAPAMLSVTSLLTESALGRYLDTVKRELKQRQRQHIKRHLLEDNLAKNLLAIATHSDMPGVLSHALEPALENKVRSLEDTAQSSAH